MEDVIMTVNTIRNSLGRLNIQSTRNNLDILLGCMQLCDKVIEALQNQPVYGSEPTDSAEEGGEEE